MRTVDEEKQHFFYLYRHFVARYKQVRARSHKSEKELDVLKELDALHKATIDLLRSNLSADSIKAYRDSIPKIAPTINKRSNLSEACDFMGFALLAGLWMGALGVGTVIFVAILCTVGFIIPLLPALLPWVVIPGVVMAVSSIPLILISSHYRDSYELIDSTKQIANAFYKTNQMDLSFTLPLYNAINEEFSDEKFSEPEEEISDKKQAASPANAPIKESPPSASLRFFPTATTPDRDSSPGSSPDPIPGSSHTL